METEAIAEILGGRKVLGKAIKNFKRSVNAQNELEVGPEGKAKSGELGSDGSDKAK